MESIMPRKLAQDVIQRNVLPPNQGGYRAGKTTLGNVGRCAYNVCDGFQRKKQTLAVAVDLEDAYDRVHFKLLMEYFVQYSVSLMLTRLLAAVLQERKVPCNLETGPPRSTTDNGTSITKDTPTETMRCLLDRPYMEARHKMEQVIAYLNAMQNPKNPLHDAVKE